MRTGKKRTSEERAAELARRGDLDRRLLEAIERLKAISAEKRAAAEGAERAGRVGARRASAPVCVRYASSCQRR